MSTSDYLADWAKKNDITYESIDGGITFTITTKAYISPKSDKKLRFILHTSENKDLLTITCPFAFFVESKYANKVLARCMEIQKETAAIRFVYDPNDGELRIQIELPMEEGNIVTHDQIGAHIRLLSMMLEKHYDLLKQ